MTISESFLQPIVIIHQRLNEIAHPWAITGSLGMALQGMDLEPRDIDLQTTREGTYAIERALAEFVTRPVYKRDSSKISSYFSELKIAGVKVEVMGDMKKLTSDGEWVEAPDLATIIRWAEYAGMRLPVLDLNHEVEAYRQMERWEKAALIQQFLDSRKI